MERYYAVHNTPIFLGYMGEDGAREIAFDVSGWKGRDGVIQLMARRPEEEVMYPVHLTEDGNYVVWTVRSGDVARAGQNGLCQLSLADGEGTVLKSGAWVTYVYTAMGSSAGVPAAPEQGWLDGWRAEVAGVKALAQQTAECAAYVSAALGREGYDPDWLEGWQAAAEETRESALEASMAASRAAVRASMAEESAAAAARALEQMKSLSGDAEFLSLVRTVLDKAVYTEDVSELLAQMDSLLESGGDSDSDGEEEEEVTLVSLSASYTGGSVPVGTAVSDLTGVTVFAVYSDGMSVEVDEYTLSGTIGEGSNTVTVHYGGKSAAFIVVGVAEDTGGDTGGDAGGDAGGDTGDDTGDDTGTGAEESACHVVVTDGDVSVTDDGEGNVTVIGMTASYDNSGNITVI